MVDVALVRSIEPHARITSIDASAALAMPGVIAVITGDDLKDIWQRAGRRELEDPRSPPAGSGHRPLLSAIPLPPSSPTAGTARRMRPTPSS